MLYFFFFNDTATTEIYTLSLHDALPIYIFSICLLISVAACTEGTNETVESAYQLPVLPEPSYKFSRNGESSVKDRKSTRLNSSHANISYAVFCLKKKTKTIQNTSHTTHR